MRCWMVAAVTAPIVAGRTDRASGGSGRASGTVPGMHRAPRSPLAARLAAGDAVAAWLQLPGSAGAELMGSLGFDAVCVDTQHGLIGPDALLPMLQALAATGTPTLVRVPSNDPAAINRALDTGADGVIVPLVDSAREAAAAASACRYPPVGDRSYGPTRRAWRAAGVGGVDRPQVTSPAEPLCIVMVETRAGVAAAAEIAAVEGVDAVFVGPSDLALAHDLPTSAQDGDPAYDALLAAVLDACREGGVPAGIYCASAAHARRFREMGFAFTVLFSEAGMLAAAAAEHLRAARRSPAG